MYMGQRIVPLVPPDMLMSFLSKTVVRTTVSLSFKMHEITGVRSVKVQSPGVTLQVTRVQFRLRL